MPFTKGTSIEGDPARYASWKKRHARSLLKKRQGEARQEAVNQTKNEASFHKKYAKQLPGYPHKSFSRAGSRGSLININLPRMGDPASAARMPGLSAEARKDFKKLGYIQPLQMSPIPPMKYEETVPLKEFPMRTRVNVMMGAAGSFAQRAGGLVIGIASFIAGMGAISSVSKSFRENNGHIIRAAMTSVKNGANASKGWISRLSKNKWAQRAAIAAPVAAAVGYGSHKFFNRNNPEAAPQQKEFQGGEYA